MLDNNLATLQITDSIIDPDNYSSSDRDEDVPSWGFCVCLAVLSFARIDLEDKFFQRSQRPCQSKKFRENHDEDFDLLIQKDLFNTKSLSVITCFAFATKQLVADRLDGIHFD